MDLTDTKKVGSFLKKKRIDRGFSQPALASETGLAVITIKEYEYGKYMPKLDNLIKIINTLKITDEELKEIAPIYKKKGIYLKAQNYNRYETLRELIADASLLNEDTLKKLLEEQDANSRKILINIVEKFVMLPPAYQEKLLKRAEELLILKDYGL